MNFLKDKSSPDGPVKVRTGGDAPSEGYVFDKILIIRLVLASILFAAALLAKLSPVLTLALLIVSALAAGYDLVMKAVNDITAKKYFEAPLIVSFVAVVAFAIGFGTEGAAIVVLYQIGMILVDYTVQRTKMSAVDFIEAEDSAVITHVLLMFSNPETGKTKFYEQVRSLMGFLSKLLLAAGLVYAIVLPLVSDYSYTVSIHRGLILMLIATPLSAIASLPLCDIVGIGLCASMGVVYNNSAAFDKTAALGEVVFDKSGVFADGKPKLVSVKSDKMPADAVIKMAAHIAAKSSQTLPMAAAAAYDGEIAQELTEDFSDIPGCGCQIVFNGLHMYLGTADFIASRGVEIPGADKAGGMCLYIALENRYVGVMTFEEGVDSRGADIVEEFVNNGITACTLLTQDDSASSAEFAAALGISEYYAGCSPEDKLAAVSHSREEGKNGAVMYVHASDMAAHSDADIDARVGANSRYADLCIEDGDLINVPYAASISNRALVISKENALLAIVVKLLIVALTVFGFCNLWFAVFLDFAAALGAVLNTIRVSMSPLFTFKKKE